MDDLPDLAAESHPERMVQAVAHNIAHAGTGHGGHDAPGPEAVSVRTATHNGHDIVIRTRYEIEIDGRPFSPAINVDNAGRVQYHGLPTRDFSSMVDLVKKAIDTFPDDFAESHDVEPSTHHPDPGHTHPPEGGGTHE